MGHSQRRPKIDFEDGLSFNAGQKYCRMHSAILSTFIKLPIVFKTFVSSIFEWPLKTGFTLYFVAISQAAGGWVFSLIFMFQGHNIYKSDKQISSWKM